MAVVVRPATRADIEAFSPMADKPTVKAWVGEIEGRIIAIGGYALAGGRWIAFCDLTPEARLHKMTLMRAARRAIAAARSQGIRFLYAQVDPSEPGAPAWLASLGFHLDPRSGILYRWRP